MMDALATILELLERCEPSQREAVFRHLRDEFAIHPLEATLNTKAEIILEAIQRAEGLTLRMLRGVIAEAVFDFEVIENSSRWTIVRETGDLAYDYRVRDDVGDVLVQVKLQRSEEGHPKKASSKKFPADTYIVETQKTRSGEKKGKKTRPYGFGEFDILAVSMFPLTGLWTSFMYTVSNWLIPNPNDSTTMKTFQPVASQPNSDWTDSFETAVEWHRSGVRRRLFEP